MIATDPSPHGLNAKGQMADKGQWQTDNANMSREMMVKTAGAISGGMSAGRDKRNDRKSNDKKSSWKKPDRSMARKDNPDKPHLPEEKDLLNDDGKRKNTIKARNQESAVEMETLIWRALCDRPKSALKYMGKDAMMSNWLVFGDTEPRSSESEPTLEEELKECEPYMSYRMHNAQVVEIGLMAVVIVYEVTLYGQAGEPDEDGTVKLQTDEATVSSTWRQTAGGDWELASMMVG